MRKLLGYVWLEVLGDTQLTWCQTGVLRKTGASHGDFGLERASEVAQLDLKNIFDHIQHCFATPSAATEGGSRATVGGTE